jgi:addiction module HigA family antidote
LTPGKALAVACRDSRYLLSGVELARRLGYTPKHISEVFHDKAPISIEMALRLEYVLQLPAGYWIDLQMSYDLDQARAVDESPTSGTPARTKGKRHATISERPSADGKTVAPRVGQPRRRLR